jgi:predicted AlkP superfamily phosphohydrolase/phosphomutase
LIITGNNEINLAMMRKIPDWIIIMLLFLISASCTSPKPSEKSHQKKIDLETAKKRVQEADQKVIFFGIDGLTWEKLDAYRKAGLLPNFDRIINEGASGHLESIDPMFSISLWTTMVTGVDFNTHGVQYFYKIGKNGSMLPYTSLDRKEKALWNIMDDMDQPSGWVSWWGSWPAEPVKGFNISNYYIADFGFRDVQEMSLFYPQDISGDLKNLKETYTPKWGETEVDRIIGDVSYINKDNLKQDTWGDFKYGSLNWVYEHNKDEFLYNFLRNDFRNDALAVNVGLQMKQKFDTRLTGIYCNGVDGVSHKFWKYDSVDRAIPSDVQNSPEDEKKYGRVLSECYITQDKLLGQVLDSMDEKTTLIITSDHGFQYVPKSNYISLNPLLYNMGYIKFNDEEEMERIDLTKSLVHEITVKPWDQRRFIRINVRSNDFKDLDGNPLGAVRAGKDESEVRSKLIDDLRKVMLKETQIPLFVDVREPTPKEVNDNEGQGDIIAQLNRQIFDSNFDDEVILPGGSTIPLNLIAIRNYHSGNHDQFDGVVIIYGALSEKSAKIEGAKLYDITPTILAMLGLPVTEKMLVNGKVLTDAIKKDFLAKYPVATIDTYGEFTHAFLNQKIMTDAGDDEVRRMLQGLGYLQ